MSRPAIKSKQAPLKESDIQQAIKTWLMYQGWYVVKIHQSLGSHRGIADLYCIKAGRSVWIEVKTVKGRLSEHQEKYRTEIEAHGGEYLIARGIEDVEVLKGV
jgi:Holliday junction resolvase